MLEVHIAFVEETESAEKCFALLAPNKYFGIEDNLLL